MKNNTGCNKKRESSYQHIQHLISRPPMLWLALTILLLLTAGCMTQSGEETAYEQFFSLFERQYDCTEYVGGMCYQPMQLRAATYDPLLEEGVFTPNIVTDVFTGFVVVQLNRDVDYTVIRELLESSESELRDAFDGDVFVLQTKQSLEELREIPGIRAAEIYQPAHRITPELFLDRIIDVHGNPLNDDVWVFEVFVYDNAEDVREKFREFGTVGRLHENYFQATMPATYIPEAIRIPEVRIIYPRPRLQTDDYAATFLTSIPDMHTAGFKGSGEIITIADTGLDTGMLDALHPAIAGKVHAIDARAGSSLDLSGHGTHVTAIAIGESETIRGVAPQARVNFQAVGAQRTTPSQPSPSFCFGRAAVDESGKIVLRPGRVMRLDGVPHDITELFENATIHTSSFGSCQGHYTPRVEMIDAYLYNKENAPVAILSAGNYATHRMIADTVVMQRGGDSLGNLARSKNAITVGATANPRGEQVHEVASFSSKGSPYTGRIKPDVVAPGGMILSARSQVCVGTKVERHEVNGTIVEEIVEIKREHCVGRGLPKDAGLAGGDRYMFLSGTSMAAPHVAGVAALVREQYQKVYDHIPSSALVKATIIAGTDILPDQNMETAYMHIPVSCSGYPNVCQGWGRVNASASLQKRWFAEDVIHDTGEFFTYDIPFAPRVVTIVWHDAPPEPLMNNLDLGLLTPSGDVFVGNTFTDTVSEKNPAAKDVFLNNNNVEKIILSEGELHEGKYTIIVSGTRIRVPSQPFAVVALE